MKTDRESVVRSLRAQGKHDKAIEATCALPHQVDTDADAAVLTELGVNAAELARTGDEGS